MRRTSFFSAILIAALACNVPRAKYKKLVIPVWGTKCEVIYKDQDKAKHILEEVEAYFTAVSDVISTYDSTSVLSSINQNKTTKLPSIITSLLNDSKLIFDASNGRFDPTVQPLVKEWGFLKQQGQWIDTTKLPEILSNVGLGLWKWNDSMLLEKPKNAAIDFNAIAPGLAADRLAALLSSKGVRDYFINNGGEIVTSGFGPGKKKWKIGITSISNPNLADTLYHVSNCAMATSGNYINQFEYNGKSYGHTISPKTGMPIQTNMVSATVFAPTAALADGFATACMAMQMSEAVSFMRKNQLTGYLMYKSTSGVIERKMVN